MHTGRQASGHGSGWIRTLHGRRRPPPFEGMKDRETGKGRRSGRPGGRKGRMGGAAENHHRTRPRLKWAVPAGGLCLGGKNSCYGDPYRGQRRGFFPFREKEFLYAPQRLPYGKSGNSGRHGKKMKKRAMIGRHRFGRGDPQEERVAGARLFPSFLGGRRRLQRVCSGVQYGGRHDGKREAGHSPGGPLHRPTTRYGRLRFAGRIRGSASGETGFRIG